MRNHIFKIVTIYVIIFSFENIFAQKTGPLDLKKTTIEINEKNVNLSKFTKNIDLHPDSLVLLDAGALQVTQTGVYVSKKKIVLDCDYEDQEELLDSLPNEGLDSVSVSHFANSNLAYVYVNGVRNYFRDGYIDMHVLTRRADPEGTLIYNHQGGAHVGYGVILYNLANYPIDQMFEVEILKDPLEVDGDELMVDTDHNLEIELIRKPVFIDGSGSEFDIILVYLKNQNDNYVLRPFRFKARGIILPR